MIVIDWIFAAVCGQNPAHTWTPGGELLPCCQRCTGLYAGALVAAALHLLLRPRLTGRFLEIHGLFLLVMVPFGYHWLPQGPLLRTVTGLLFGAGLVTFLTVSLKPLGRSPPDGGTHSGRRYFVGLVLGGALTLALATSGWRSAPLLLTLLATVGGLTLLVMVGLNAAHYAIVLWRLGPARFRRQRNTSAGALGRLSPVLNRGESSAGS